MIDDANPYPNETWTLKDWFDAVGVKADAEVADEAMRMGVTDHTKPWNPKRINELKNGTKTTEPGINNRATALDYITVLKSIAARNKINLFTPHRMDADIEIFLRSKACRDKYAPPDHIELQQVFQHDTTETGEKMVHALRSRVHPTPPPELFGRKQDLDTVLKAIQDNPITVIDGIAGDGKTSLAWFSAIAGYEQRMYNNFDWLTDKRNVLNIYGELLPIVEADNDITFFDNLLISICSQFGWHDLLGSRGDRLISKCADRLRSGRYLLVVDNLETVENSEMVVRQLSDMLIPVFSREPVSSHALITTRVKVSHSFVTSIPLQGIEAEASHDFIEHLQTLWTIEPRLTDVQISRLTKATGGNPLFLQLSLRRYDLYPTSDSFDKLIGDLEKGQDKAFDSLFGVLVDLLSKQAYDFAKAIAFELVLSSTSTKHNDLKYIWESVFKGDDQPHTLFLKVLEELINHRILSYEGHAGTYSMHALILAYFLGLSDGT